MFVSVIIPIYNVKEYLNDCIISVLNQDYNNLEIILVDNNSNDGSDEIAKSYSLKYDNIIYTIEPKQGAPAARNKGLSLCRGELIQFLDADDFLDPQKISHQVKLFNERSDIDFIYADYRLQKSDGGRLDKIMFRSDYWLALLKSKLGCTCSNLWRTSSVKNIEGWNESLHSSQEYDLMFRLMKKNALVHYDNHILTTVRQRNSGNISSSNLARNWKTYVDLRCQIIQYLKTEKIDIPQSYYQVLFDCIRSLHKHDPKTAEEVFNNFLPDDFCPVKSDATSIGFIFLYKFFGYRAAEKFVEKYKRF